MDRTTNTSMRTAALVAGIGYVVILVFNTLALATLDGQVLHGDAASTLANIMAAESSFRLGIASWTIVLATDLIVAWALYVYLRPVHRDLALLTAWLRLLFVAVATGGLLGLLAIVHLVSGADELGAFASDQLAAQVMLALVPYESGLNVAFVFFGLHVLGLGYLILRSDYVPRVLGVLLAIACLGYLINGFGSLLSADYAANDAFFLVLVAIPAIVAEYGFALWLLVRGRNVELGSQTLRPVRSEAYQTSAHQASL